MGLKTLLVRVFENTYTAISGEAQKTKGVLQAAPSREEVQGLRISTKLPGGFAEASFTFKGADTYSGRLEAARWHSTLLGAHIEITSQADGAFYGLIDEMTHDRVGHAVSVLARGYYSTTADRAYDTTSTTTESVENAIWWALSQQGASVDWRGSFLAGGVGDVTAPATTVQRQIGTSGLETVQDAIEQWLAPGDSSGTRYWPSIWNSRTLRVEAEGTAISWYCRTYQMGQAAFSQSRLDVWNAVRVSHVDPDTGTRTLTAWAEDTASQQRYGRRDMTYPAAELPAAAAVQLADTILSNLAWPRDRPALSLTGSVLDGGMVERPLWMVRAGHIIKALDLDLHDRPAGATVLGRNAWLIRETHYDADSDTLDIVPELPEQNLPEVVGRALRLGRGISDGSGRYIRKDVDDTTTGSLSIGSSSPPATVRLYVQEGLDADANAQPAGALPDGAVAQFNGDATNNTIINLLAALTKKAGFTIATPSVVEEAGLVFDCDTNSWQLYIGGVLALELNSTGLYYYTVDISSGGGITALTGDVTASGTGSVAATIAADAVTFAKMQNISTDRLLGRDTAATGNVEEIGLGASLEFSGSQTIQRAALTGVVVAAANSNAMTFQSTTANYAALGPASGGAAAATFRRPVVADHCDGLNEAFWNVRAKPASPHAYDFEANRTLSGPTGSIVSGWSESDGGGTFTPDESQYGMLYTSTGTQTRAAHLYKAPPSGDFALVSFCHLAVGALITQTCDIGLSVISDSAAPTTTDHYAITIHQSGKDTQIAHHSSTVYTAINQTVIGSGINGCWLRFMRITISSTVKWLFSYCAFGMGWVHGNFITEPWTIQGVGPTIYSGTTAEFRGVWECLRFDTSPDILKPVQGRMAA